MAYCSKCGKVVRDGDFCENCGSRIGERPVNPENDKTRLGRFLLTFFLGCIGSFFINHTYLKPVGWKSRTCAYFFLGALTFGIYPLVASIYNFMFKIDNEINLGYFKEKKK